MPLPFSAVIRFFFFIYVSGRNSADSLWFT
jgi:hypothetical protein